VKKRPFRGKKIKPSGSLANQFFAQVAVEADGVKAREAVAPDSPASVAVEEEIQRRNLEEGMEAAKEISDAADLRERAFDLYRGPFRYEHGYIWDKDNEMVADDHVEGAVPALQVRGWGRLRYFADSAALHDAVGALMAEALTAYWKSEFQRRRSR